MHVVRHRFGQMQNKWIEVNAFLLVFAGRSVMLFISSIVIDVFCWCVGVCRYALPSQQDSGCLYFPFTILVLIVLFIWSLPFICFFATFVVWRLIILLWMPFHYNMYCRRCICVYFILKQMTAISRQFENAAFDWGMTAERSYKWYLRWSMRCFVWFWNWDE